MGFIGELIGLLTTIYAGVRFGGVFLLLACVGIIMFIFCDYFFAVKLHRNKILACGIETEKLLAKDQKKIVTLENRLSQGRFVDFLLRAGIIVVAIVKIAAILLLGVFNSLVLYFPFAVIYLIVAFVHLNHTGYYFAYIDTERSIKNEYKRLDTGQFDTNEVRESVSMESPLRDLPIKHNPHVIREDSGQGAAKTGYKYMITAKGILTDDDILNLIDGQDDNNRVTLFKACRKLQLENFMPAWTIE